MRFWQSPSTPQKILFGLLTLASIAPAAATEISVSSDGDIQAALDQCPATGGCVIRIAAGTYDLPNSLFLRNKQDIRITGAGAVTRPVIRFQDDGSLAGPDSDPDTLTMKPKGWKHWPVDGTTQIGGAANTSNPFSTSGIQRNGTIVIQGCTNIVLDSLVIDGKAPLGWGSIGVWENRYPTFYGNFGVNLFYSTAVTIKNCDIRNCFAGIYMKGARYVFPSQIPPNCDVVGTCAEPMDIAFTGKGGSHRIEHNSIHHNVWAVYNESNSGASLVLRFNKVWENHNASDTFAKWKTDKSPCFDRTNWNKSWAEANVCSNSEAMTHAGGFLYYKDSSSRDSIESNTLWRNALVLGYSGWLHGSCAFSNNLVTEPWLDYNSDTTGFRTTYFSSQAVSFLELLTSGMDTLSPSRANTFALFPKILPNTTTAKPSACNGSLDSCTALRAALRAQVWPANRLQFQTQVVLGDSFLVDGSRLFLQPLAQLRYIGGLQYQGNQRGFLYQNAWRLESPRIDDFRMIQYTREVDAAESGNDAIFLKPFTYQSLDSNQIAARFGRLHGLPDADTLGLILSMGKVDSGCRFQNHYIKSVPMDLDPSSPSFLSPIWGDAGIDSVIRGKAWAPAGQIAPTARGAVMPEDVSVGVVARSPHRLQGLPSLGRDGHLQFAQGTPDGICQILSVNGRQLASLDIQGGRSRQTLSQRGLLVVRWKSATAWQQASILRP